MKQQIRLNLFANTLKTNALQIHRSSFIIHHYVK